MIPPDSFGDIIQRLKTGDDLAAQEVFERFAARLVALAQSRLDVRLRQKVDAEDVMQSVYKSFFCRHARGQFTVGSWDSLWSLLTVLTVRKCANRAKQFRRASRDVRRELGESRETAFESDSVSREPTPEEASMLTDTLEALLKGYNERDQAIVTQALQGHEEEEISAAVGYSCRTVRRVLAHFRDQLTGEGE